MTFAKSPSIIPRFSARILLIDSYERLLLLHAPGGEDPAFWFTPGGVVEGGEGWEEAARRELWEETGLEPTEISPCVWIRTHAFEWDGKRYESHERFFIVHSEPFTPAPGALEGWEARPVGEYKWWSLYEIEDATNQVFVPRALGFYFKQLLEGAVPESPIDVGV